MLGLSGTWYCDSGESRFGLEGSSTCVVCMFMLRLGKESEKKSIVGVVLILGVDVRDIEGSVCLGLFL